jgi:hypothetical protein
MSSTELAWRSLHDLGLASWFGGSVFGSVALPHTDDDDTTKAGRRQRAVEGETWRRWSPVVTGSMAAHLVGGAGLILANRSRHRYQKGVATATTVKTVLTVTAVALTIGAAAEGYRSQERRRKLEEGGDESLQRAQERADRLMRVVGPLIPATTGALVVLGALEGEQQRPREVVRGVVASALESLQESAQNLPARALGTLQDSAQTLPARALDALPGR